MSLNKRIPPASAAGGPYAAIFEFTGAGSSDVTVSGMSFQPDFIQFRKYEEIGYTYMCNALRPDTFWRTLQNGNSSGTNVSDGNNDVIQWNSDGFTIKGNSSTDNTINKSGRKYIGLALFAGNTSVSNNDGNVTSTVMASPDSGFSMVKFTSAGSSTTFGHGLGSTPDIVVANRPGEFYGLFTWYEDTTHYNEFRQGQGFLYTNNSNGSASKLISFPDSDTIQVSSSHDGGGNSGDDYYFFCFVQKPHQQFAMWNGNFSNSTRTLYSMTDDSDPKYVRTNLVDNSSSGLDMYQPLHDSTSGSKYVFTTPLTHAEGGTTNPYFVNLGNFGQSISLDWGSNERLISNASTYWINGNYASYDYHYIAYIWGGDDCEIL